jgi:hypothetical protein
MRRFFGGVVGKKAKDYNSATKSGIFAVNEQMILHANDEWVFQPGTDISTALASTAAADTAYNEGDLTTAGMYWFDFGGSHTPAQYYYRPQSWNYTGTQYGAILVFKSVSQSAPTVNHLNQYIPMNSFIAGRLSGSTTGVFGQSAEVDFSSQQTFDSTTGITGTEINKWTDGGTHFNGTKVMLGGGGRHGLYNTGQNSCSWGNSTGSVGAGYDGTCGSYPNGLKLGLGDGDAFYNTISGTFEFWIKNT